MRNVGSYRHRRRLGGLARWLGVLIAAALCGCAADEPGAHGLGRDVILLQSVPPSGSRGGSVGLFSYGLTYEDYQRLRAAMPEGTVIVPVKRQRVSAAVEDRRETWLALGTTEAYFELVDVGIADGRGIRELDEQRFRRVAVLSPAGVRALPEARAATGELVRLDGSEIRIIGLARSGRAYGVPGAGLEEPHAYLPLSTFRVHFGDIGLPGPYGGAHERIELHEILIRLRSTDSVRGAMATIAEALRPRYSKQTDRPDVLIVPPTTPEPADGETAAPPSP